MGLDDENKQLAVLIDADNAQAAIIEGLLSEIAKYGTANVKKIYGDWTDPNLIRWKDCLLKHSIQPMQKFSYTTGKNSTDSALIIDAMDLLYTKNLDGFCIISSDSDYTGLAARIRQDGLIVYGFGEKKTPKSLIAACDKFIYTENLRKDEEEEGTDQVQQSPKVSTNELKGDTKLVSTLRIAVEDSAQDDGWALLSIVGNNLVQKEPDFDSRNYGYKKLGELFKAIGLFNIKEARSNNSNNSMIYVKDKRR
ncbi:MAG: NYN domain-containing protein [Euryarchaeota archaeon]|nr:NYN domain-containing protein [Euryarchaeota archaeon]